MKLSARESTSPLPCMGMLAGLLLLGFSGVIVIMQSMPVVPEAATAGAFLPRRLQYGGGFGYITTSREPSSFDSSDSSSSGSSFEPSKSLESGSMESSEFKAVQAKVFQSVGSGMGYLSFSLALQIIFAFLYSSYVTNPIVDSGKLDTMIPNGADAGRDDFNNGICSCLNDRWVFLHGLCCPMVRLAHTNAVSGVCPFWESLWCWCCCAWLTFNIGPFCLLMWWRLRLKNIMKIEENAMNDFCITMFCPQLSICQMATAVDTAMGYQTTGCCEYRWSKDNYDGPMIE